MIRRMAANSNAEAIIKSLKTVSENIQKAVERRPSTLPQINPRLVAVSKTKPVADIITAYDHGQRHFGENYIQELDEKAREPMILERCTDIRWHLIGHVQRNKANKITTLPNLHMVESVDNPKLAKTLSNNWGKFKRPGTLYVKVQVNTSGESNKSGCNVEDVQHLVTFIKTECPHLTFTGLMTIGAYGYDPSTGPNVDFLKLVQCRENLCKELNLGLSEVELSMGMSTDYEHAIELGSTNIRVGSTIFGARNKPATSNPPAASQHTEIPSTSTDVGESDNVTKLNEGIEQITIDDDGKSS